MLHTELFFILFYSVIVFTLNCFHTQHWHQMCGGFLHTNQFHSTANSILTLFIVSEGRSPTNLPPTLDASGQVPGCPPTGLMDWV